MVTIPDISQSAVEAEVKEKVRDIEEQSGRERDYLMDWHGGINIEG